MWTATARSDLKDAFDDAFEIAYGNGRKGELENLANLFGPIALNNYQQALLKGLDIKSSAAVDIAWIDKRPIAKLSEKATGAELGDMMLVVHEFDPDGIRVSRACLLEVKQSPTSAIPPVPVTRGDSTHNQFEILSAWPTLYGLKATGSNHDYLLENVVTRPGGQNGGILTQAWYVAVKPPSGTATPTPTPWMAAPAVDGAPFEHTLGDVFGACSRGDSLKNSAKPTSIGVGREFVAGLSLQSPPGWDALINAITYVATSYDLPKSYFGNGPGRRYVSGHPFTRFIAFGGLNVPFATTSSASSFFTGVMITCVAFALTQLFRTRNRARHKRLDAQVLMQDKEFPVLFFYVRHGEKDENFRDRKG